MTKNWDTMTLTEHMASNEVSGAHAEMEEACRIYAETHDRWQRESKINEVDAADTREFYGIDKCVVRVAAAQERFNAAVKTAVKMGVSNSRI